MGSTVTRHNQNSKATWTPKLVRRLRGKRTLLELAGLLGVSKNTIWRWEAGYSRPDASCAARLSLIAKRERFFEDWRLVGSMRILGSLEAAQLEISKLFRHSLDRSAREL